MATYIALCNWTDRGAQQVRESPKRFDAAKKLLREMGGDIKQFYLHMGDYDLDAVAAEPDGATHPPSLYLLPARARSVNTSRLIRSSCSRSRRRRA